MVKWFGLSLVSLMVIAPIWFFPFVEISFFYKSFLSVVGLIAGWYFVEYGKGAKRGIFTR